MYLDSTYFNSPKILDLRDYENVFENFNLNDVIIALGTQQMIDPKEIPLTNLEKFWEDVNTEREIFFRLSMQDLCMDVAMHKMFVEETGEVIQINGNCVFSMTSPFFMVNLAIMNNSLYIYTQTYTAKKS